MDQENNFDESYIPNTDDFNKKSKIDDVLNNKRNETHACYRQLMQFLNDYKIRKGETDNYDELRNFCDVYRKQVYHIPNDRIFKFMDHIEACRDNHLKLNFQEYQHERASGMMFDFDILLNHDKSVIPKIKFDELIQMFFEIFTTTINFELNTIKKSSDDDSDSDPEYDDDDVKEPCVVKHAVIIRKTKVSYKQDLQKYKDGFHLLFPNIKVSRKLKKYLLKKILDCKPIIRLFKEINLNLSEILDKNSVSVPIFLFGSSKVGGDPYKLYKVYSAKLYKDYVKDVNEYENKLDRFNLICEFSINYTTENGLIPNKIRYRQKSHLRKEVDIFNEHHKYNFDDIELDEINKDIALKNLYLPDTEYMKSLLGCLSIERLTNYDSWIKLMFALANTADEYKSLAAWVSKRVPEKWDPAMFENIWNTAINSRSSAEHKLSERSIIYWAKEDNLKKFEEMTNKSIKEIINSDIYDDVLSGDILPRQYAKYLRHMFGEKFATDTQPESKGHEWFEFVLPTDSLTDGSVYKWRLEKQSPDSLLIYLSDKLVVLLREILGEINTRINNEGDEAIIKYLTVIKKNFVRSIKKLFTPTFKQQVIIEAAPIFRSRGFIDRLDTDKHLLGVNNGVLDLNNIKLIDTIHEYPITYTTGVKYVPYDKKNKYIKHVEKVIKNLFPDNEMDVHEFIMYYIASCLDGRPKQSIILIITGVGCHAIDSEILMFNKTVKKVQDVNVGDLVMGDDNTPRLVKELFRGRDQMVEVIPTNQEDSFTVNKNHILSLKFNNMNPRVRSIGDFGYEAIWYSKLIDSNEYEPIRQSKRFLEKSHADEFIVNINNASLIRDGQIIDIKITDLLKWNKWWVLYGKLVLYKINRITSEFTLKLLEEDEYYGFELDGNHRYQTADYYIHHNSNGKSFFFEFAKSILGPKYGVKMELAFLTDKRKKSSGADPALMALEHGRLCHYSETEQNEEMNTARVKEITGQESLAGRNLYEKQKNFRPAAHHLITCNHHLSIQTTDHGTWRRIRTYKFKIVFTQNPDLENPNERLLDSKVAEEYATDDRYKEAFLSILVEYYRRLQSEYEGNILNIPCPTIEKETNDYRNNEDVVSAFIDARAIVSLNAKQSMADVVQAYRNWYTENVGPNLTSNIQQLNNIMLNSKICKHFKLENKLYVLKGLRILEKDDELTKGERYYSEM